MKLASLLRLAAITVAVVASLTSSAPAAPRDGRFLYVSVPSLGRQPEFGGRGLLVFDIDHRHRFVRRIPMAGLAADGSGRLLSTKGIVASEKTNRVWVSTTEGLMCADLDTEKLLWEKLYDGGCDRMALSPDGRTMYLPTFEGDFWYVVDALTGDIIKRLEVKSAAHNTLFSAGGKRAYLAGIQSPWLNIADARDHTLLKPAGQRLHVFDVSGMTAQIPPRQVASIETPREQPGWITFSIDGKFAYPSTGEVIDTATRKIVAQLVDETGAEVQSEKVLEIQFRADKPVTVGNQFGIGRGPGK